MQKQSQLELLGLPVFSKTEDLAELMHLSPYFLKKFHLDKNRFYKKLEIEKKSGGIRKVYQPSRQLKAIQGWILYKILNPLKTHSACKGFEKNQNTLSNALPHRGAKAVITIDIKDFFPTIKAPTIKGIFENVGYSKQAASILTELCTYEDFLPQGSPCSPRLANLVCKKLDEDIQNYVSEYGVIYTRYADDMSFSSPYNFNFIHIIKPVKQFIRDAGFEINKRKLRVAGTSRRKEVTGLVINGYNVGIGKHKYRILRSKFNHLCKGISPDKKLVKHAQGWLYYLNSVDKERYHQLKNYIIKLQEKYPDSDIQEIGFIKEKV